MAERNVYWHLPGLSSFFHLNQVLLSLMKRHPDKFLEGYRIGSVYGTFPGAIWNGGRGVFGTMPRPVMETVLKTYNGYGVPVRFTWTNSLLEEKHTFDTYCNLIMELADNGMNQVLVNTPVLEEYLRRTYPGFEYISSTTKRITTLAELEAELAREYKLVVLDYDLNHDEELLKALEPQAGRIELLVDEICQPDCPARAEHYRAESYSQLRFDRGKPFPCVDPERQRGGSFLRCMDRPAFISKDQVAEYADKGYVNFKLIGRGLPMSLVKESYVYYLVKDEYMPFINKQLDAGLAQIEASRKENAKAPAGRGE